MRLRLPGRIIDCISVMYRDDEIQEYDPEEVFKFIRLSDEFEYTSILLFESNKGNIEPWVLGQAVMCHSQRLVPFIAVNPLFMHPFIAAKKILTLSTLYKRKTFINFITGTSNSDLNNLNDNLSHDERYARLGEYIRIVDHLLKSRVPLNFEGRYYSLKKTVLSTALNSQLLPKYFVAGSSAMAQEIRQQTGAFKATMAKDVSDWQNSELLPSNGTAVHFGIIARSTSREAQEYLDGWIQISADAADVFDYVMTNTASKWKLELGKQPESDDAVFTLKPFKNLKSDCPYYVGSYEEIADVIVKYALNGYDTLIIELPAKRKEFEHIRRAMEMAQDVLQAYQ